MTELKPLHYVWDLAVPISPPPPVLPGRGEPGAISPRAGALLDDLEALYFSEGFAKFTLSDIAERFRCSRRTIFELAPSHSGVVLLVLDRMLQRMGRMAVEATAHGRTRLEQLTMYLHAGVVEVRSATLRFSEDVAGTPEVQQLFDAHVSYGCAVIEAIVAAGVTEGEFGAVHARLVAEMLHVSVARCQAPDFLAAADMTMPQAVDELFGIVANALRPTGRPPGRLRAERTGRASE